MPRIEKKKKQETQYQKISNIISLNPTIAGVWVQERLQHLFPSIIELYLVNKSLSFFHKSVKMKSLGSVKISQTVNAVLQKKNAKEGGNGISFALFFLVWRIM